MSPSASGFTVRPMQSGDVPSVGRLAAESLDEGDLLPVAVDLPTPVLRTQERARLWTLRMGHILAHDPGGCWVAEAGAGLLGASVALKRDLTWILSAFVVRPGMQGRGVDRQLLEAALSHGDGCLRGMLSASPDPLALRHYRLAGFSLHPTMDLTGTVDRSLLPVVERVREGSTSDIDLMNSVDRQVRDAAHGVDHELLTTMYRLVVVDRSTGSGYAYAEDDGSPYLLAATNRRTAADLLWEAMAGSRPDTPCRVERVTPANEWAIDVGMAAGLPLRTTGYLALRNMKPPMPYLPSAHFL